MLASWFGSRKKYGYQPTIDPRTIVTMPQMSG
jgi:hypothetical protein